MNFPEDYASELPAHSCGVFRFAGDVIFVMPWLKDLHSIGLESPCQQGMLANARTPPVPLNSLTPNEPLIQTLPRYCTSYVFNPLNSS
jgi:hypothetical protein